MDDDASEVRSLKRIVRQVRRRPAWESRFGAGARRETRQRPQRSVRLVRTAKPLPGLSKPRRASADVRESKALPDASRPSTPHGWRDLSAPPSRRGVSVTLEAPSCPASPVVSPAGSVSARSEAKSSDDAVSGAPHGVDDLLVYVERTERQLASLALSLGCESDAPSRDGAEEHLAQSAEDLGVVNACLDYDEAVERLREAALSGAASFRSAPTFRLQQRAFDSLTAQLFRVREATFRVATAVRAWQAARAASAGGTAPQPFVWRGTLLSE